MRRAALGGTVGAGESYMDGDWSSPDLVSLIRLVIANRRALRRITPAALVNIAGDKLIHALRAHRPAFEDAYAALAPTMHTLSGA